MAYTVSFFLYDAVFLDVINDSLKNHKDTRDNILVALDSSLDDRDLVSHITI